MAFVIRAVVTAVALWVATLTVRGISLTGSDPARNILSLLLIGVIVGIVNATIKPAVKAIGCPLYVLTLGLFALLVNGVLLMGAAWVAGLMDIGFHVAGLRAALWGALVVSLVTWALGLVIADRD